METYEEKRKKALEKTDKIIAYRNEVDEKALRKSWPGCNLLFE